MEQHERTAMIRQAILSLQAHDSTGRAIFTWPRSVGIDIKETVQVALAAQGGASVRIVVRSKALTDEQRARLTANRFVPGFGKDASLSDMHASAEYLSQHPHSLVVESGDPDDLVTLVEWVFLTVFGSPVDYTPSIRNDLSTGRIGRTGRLVAVLLLAAFGAGFLYFVWTLVRGMEAVGR
jgi:hypothetical protein